MKPSVRLRVYKPGGELASEFVFSADSLADAAADAVLAGVKLHRPFNVIERAQAKAKCVLWVGRADDDTRMSASAQYRRDFILGWVRSKIAEAPRVRCPSKCTDGVSCNGEQCNTCDGRGDIANL